MSLVHDHIEVNRSRLSTNIDALLLEPSLNKKHSFYFNLTEYLVPIFENVSIESARSLSFSSYGYFRSILLLDSLLDDAEPSSGGKKLLSFIEIYEAAFIELAHLIPHSDVFWDLFNQSKKKYFEAVFFEKSLSARPDTFTQESFERLAEGKSAVLSYNILYALEALQKFKHEKRVNIIDYLKHIHIAYQYQDDVDDFKDDLIKGQISYANCLVNWELSKYPLDLADHSIDFKHRFLFSSGIAVSLLTEAIRHYQICSKLAESLEIDSFYQIAKNGEKRCEGQILEINLLIEKTKRKYTKSNEQLFFNKISHVSRHEIKVSIDRSTEYLIQNLGQDNLWSDFVTTAGTSKYWVSSYVSYHLLSAGINISNLQKVLDTLAAEAAAASFNKQVPDDGDSMNFLVGVLNHLKPEMDNALVNRWICFQNDDGGWVTYRNEELLRSSLNISKDIALSGWTGAVPCVSAAAGVILKSLSGTEEQLAKTRHYLANEQNPDGSWKSYWWTSPLYATSWAVRSLKDDAGYLNVYQKGIDWILNTQCDTGAWHDTFLNEPNPFFTSMALAALLDCNEPRCVEAINAGVEWLLSKQCSDGSWLSSKILAIPATDITDHTKVEKWRKSSFGVNVLVDDDNRVFTTATALNVLHHFNLMQ